MIGIGSTIWHFDINRRVYDGNGLSEKLIYREHWVPRLITGETSRSWIVATGSKVSKRGDHRGWAFSQQEVDDDVWRNDHRYKIIRLAERCNASVLRKIAELVGYKEDSP